MVCHVRRFCQVVSTILWWELPWSQCSVSTGAEEEARILETGETRRIGDAAE